MLGCPKGKVLKMLGGEVGQCDQAVCIRLSLEPALPPSLLTVPFPTSSVSVIWSLGAVRPHPDSPPSTPLGAAWLPEHIRGTGVWGWPLLCWSPRLPEPGLHKETRGCSCFLMLLELPTRPCPQARAPHFTEWVRGRTWL